MSNMLVNANAEGSTNELSVRRIKRELLLKLSFRFWMANWIAVFGSRD